MQCPLVDNCAVAPVPDEIRGEEVMACVILSSDAESVEATAEQIFEHCAATLTYFKLPGYIALVDSLPTTSTQKIQRGEMKKRCQNFARRRQRRRSQSAQAAGAGRLTTHCHESRTHSL